MWMVLQMWIMDEMIFQVDGQDEKDEKIVQVYGATKVDAFDINVPPDGDLATEMDDGDRH